MMNLEVKFRVSSDTKPCGRFWCKHAWSTGYRFQFLSYVLVVTW